MNELQKMIKNLATLLAVFLSIVIIGGGLTVVMAVFGLISGSSSHMVSSTTTMSSDEIASTSQFLQEYSENEIKAIHIHDIDGKIVIKEGDSFSVQADNVNEDFTCNVTNAKVLNIGSKDNVTEWLQWLSNENRVTVTITVPNDFTTDKLDIEAGAGDIELSDLVMKSLSIDGGTGNISGKNLMADNVSINGGVGNITFSDIDFTDSYIDGGIGNVLLEGVFYGKTDIDCGVGECTLRIQKSIDDYTLEIDPGVGSIYIDDNKYSKDQIFQSSSENYINIDGGVGNLSLAFE